MPCPYPDMNGINSIMQTMLRPRVSDDSKAHACYAMHHRRLRAPRPCLAYKIMLQYYIQDEENEVLTSDYVQPT